MITFVFFFFISFFICSSSFVSGRWCQFQAAARLMKRDLTFEKTNQWFSASWHSVSGRGLLGSEADLCASLLTLLLSFMWLLYVMCSEQLREERFNTCHFINRNISHDCVDEHELGMSQKGLWKLSNYHRLGRRLLFRDIKGTGWCTAVSTPLSLMDTKDINNWQTLQTDWLSSSDEVVFMAFINRNFLNNLWTNISGKKNSCTNHFTEKTLKKTSPLLLIHSSSTSSLTPTKRFVINQPESQELDG